MLLMAGHSSTLMAGFPESLPVLYPPCRFPVTDLSGLVHFCPTHSAHIPGDNFVSQFSQKSEKRREKGRKKEEGREGRRAGWMDKRTDGSDKQTNRRKEPDVVAHACQLRVERMRRKFGLISR